MQFTWRAVQSMGGVWQLLGVTHMCICVCMCIQMCIRLHKYASGSAHVCVRVPMLACMRVLQCACSAGGWCNASHPPLVYLVHKKGPAAVALHAPAHLGLRPCLGGRPLRCVGGPTRAGLRCHVRVHRPG